MEGRERDEGREERGSCADVGFTLNTGVQSSAFPASRRRTLVHTGAKRHLGGLKEMFLFGVLREM